MTAQTSGTTANRRANGTATAEPVGGSAPAEGRGHVVHDRLQHVGAVVDAELVGDGQQQGVGGGDRLVAGQLLDQPVGLAGVRLAEAGLAAVEDPDLVAAAALGAEVGLVEVVDDREDAAADRRPRRSGCGRRRPRPCGSARSARPGAGGTARRCPRTAASSSSGSCPAGRSTRRWHGCRRPTRCGRAGRGSAARCGAGRAGWGTSGAGWARRSPSPRAPGGTSRCARAPGRRGPGPRAARSRSSGSRRRPAPVTPG